MTQSPDGAHAGFRALVEGLLEANLARDPARALLITRREAVALFATSFESQCMTFVDLSDAQA